MQKNGKQLNPVHKASGSSKQNKTARFFRELGKLAIEHPILTVSMIVTAASFTFGSGKAQAQTKDKAKTELALLTTGEKKDVENDRKVTYENGIKIVGEKTFDVEILNDSLYFPNSKLKNGHIGTAVINIEEILFEILGPGGAAVLVEGITDNKNRALNDIKQVLSRFGAKMTGEGSLRWLFEKKGCVVIDLTSQPEGSRKDDLELLAIEAGAQDIVWHDDNLNIYTKSDDLEKVRHSLSQKEIKITSVSLDWVPKEQINLSEKDKQLCQNMFEALDDLDAVQEIYSNIKF